MTTVCPGQIADREDAELAFTNGPTSDSELVTWLEANMPTDPSGQSTFAGVISGDQGSLLGTRSNRGFLINCDSNPDAQTFIGGTHWVCCWMCHELPRCIMYVDSLAQPCPASITDHARARGFAVLSPTDRTQQNDTPADQQCGQRACFTLRDLANGDLTAFRALLPPGSPVRVRG